MRVWSALAAMAAGKKKNGGETAELTTLWSEGADGAPALREYPRPQLRREEWLCLNGPWRYAFTERGVRPERFDGTIQVPFSPESRRSGVGRRLEPGGYLWYFRALTLCGVPKGRRLLLHFGAVDDRCFVWWNGSLLGSHRNGYLPFSFDVTEHLREGKNTIWVRVQDDSDAGRQCRGKQSLHPKGMFYTAQSGIWQTVWLEWVPENYIERLKITPLFDEGEVRLELVMARPEAAEILIQGRDTSYLHHLGAEAFQLVDKGNGGGVRPGAGGGIRMGAGMAGGGAASAYRAVCTVALPELRPWSPEDPFLYDLEIRAGEDRVRSYFAMRKFSAGTDEKGRPRLMLNNRPYFFNGVLDQGYWPESLYTPPDDRAMIFDIEQMKALGFNLMRKHVKIEPLRWYYHCDRLGMAVWQDMVNGGGRLSMLRLCYLPTLFPSLTARVRDSAYRFFARTDAAARRSWEEDCLAEVEHLYNCPCIGMWVPFNEGWGQFDALRITGAIRRLDGSRPVDHASGWFDQGGGDVKSVHNYFRRLRVQKDRRPFVLSEYGGITWAAEGHTYSSASYGYRTCRSREQFAREFWKLQNRISQLEKQGLSAAVYTQVSDIEEEINGLFTYDRRVCKLKAPE